MPTIIDSVVIISPALILKRSESHLENLELSPSSEASAASEERMSAPIPTASEETKFTMPRTKNAREKRLRSSGGFTLRASVCKSPFSSRTTVAMARLPRIMTPSITA